MKRRQAESALGTPLPAETADVEFHRWRPAPGIDYAIAYARLQLSRAAALAFQDRLGLGADAVYLATGWQVPAESAPEWWPAEPAMTLTDQAARATDGGGWLIAGYAEPYLYLLAYET
ncbi:hypothetical protein [Amycolatopsis silviterrae]|uniref:Uncharacterized protein n=1 Tax=Amycolatopsis silviterrae TaxID=1656914 RepID=A0ABW5HBV5_9PSEU